jgi:hypothetical protein
MIVYHGAKAHSCCGDGTIFHTVSDGGTGYQTHNPRRRLANPILEPEPLPPPMPVKVLMRDGLWLDPPEMVTP